MPPREALLDSVWQEGKCSPISFGIAHIRRPKKSRYEESLRKFQRSLAEQPPPGFRNAASYRIPAVPWLGDQSGYEDWCHIEGSWALDALNGFAVAGRVKGPHDAAAAQMDVGYGGLYTLVWGTPELPHHRTVIWLTRPRGLEWRTILDPLRAQLRDAVCWRRQMVLGPAPEFALVVPPDQKIVLPYSWKALSITGERL